MFGRITDHRCVTIFAAAVGLAFLLPAIAAAQAAGDDAANVPPERDPQLKKLVDPILHWEAPEVPEEQNAWPLWEEALEKYISPADAGIEERVTDVRSRRHASEQEGLYAKVLDAATESQEHALTNRDIDRISRWIESNEQVFQLLSEGAARTHLAIGDLKGIDSVVVPIHDLTHIRDLVLIDTWLAARSGDYHRFKRRLTLQFDMSRLLLTESHTLVGFLLGLSIEANTLKQSRHLLRSNQLPIEIQRYVLENLRNAPNTAKALANVYRAEFWRFYVWELRAIQEKYSDADQDALLARLAAHGRWNDDDAEGGDLQGLDIADLPSILTIEFFDYDQTVALAGRIMADAVRHVDGSATTAGPFRNKYIEATRKRIRIAEDKLRKALADGTVSDNEVKELSDELDNLFGHLFVDTVIPALGRPIMLERRNSAERSATSWMLAIAIEESATGEPLKDVNDLVVPSVIESLPDDPFGKGPLRYDPERRIIWSVGENGVDDGGKSDEEAIDGGNRWEQPDAIWRVPPFEAD